MKIEDDEDEGAKKSGKNYEIWKIEVFFMKILIFILFFLFFN